MKPSGGTRADGEHREGDSTIEASDPTSVEADSPAASRDIESHELLGAAREVRILHGGETYRLRLTSKGKLILTK